MSEAPFILWRNPVNAVAMDACDTLFNAMGELEEPMPDGLDWLRLLIGLVEIGLFAAFIAIFIIYTKVTAIALLVLLLFAPAVILWFVSYTLVMGIIRAGSYIQNKVSPKPDRHHKR